MLQVHPQVLKYNKFINIRKVVITKPRSLNHHMVKVFLSQLNAWIHYSYFNNFFLYRYLHCFSELVISIIYLNLHWFIQQIWGHSWRPTIEAIFCKDEIPLKPLVSDIPCCWAHAWPPLLSQDHLILTPTMPALELQISKAGWP